MTPINKRQNEILGLVKERSSLSVAELLPFFDVSPVTVRKDLALLEEEGLIVRTHGEVHIVKREATSFEARRGMNMEAKSSIAKAAAELVRDGDTIILDSGTTTLEIARLLADRRGITVLTNSLPVAYALDGSQLLVSLAGGLLFHQNMSTQGPDTEKFFADVQVDKAFMAASGIRSDQGLAALSAIEAGTKRSMLKAAREVYAVVDSSKFATSSVYAYAAFEELDCVITDSPIRDPALRKRFKALGLKCLLAGPGR